MKRLICRLRGHRYVLIWSAGENHLRRSTGAPAYCCDRCGHNGWLI